MGLGLGLVNVGRVAQVKVFNNLLAIDRDALVGAGKIKERLCV